MAWMALKFNVRLQNTALSGRSSGRSLNGTPRSSSRARVAVCSCGTDALRTSFTSARPSSRMTLSCCARCVS